jgi:hypothetical protein
VAYGLDERLNHVPGPDPDDAPVTHVYAIARFKDGSPAQFEVMTKKQVDKIRKRSKSANNGPWVTDYDEMSLKTVVRRLCKRLPLSDFDLARAIEADNQDYEEGALVETGESEFRRETRTAALVGRLSTRVVAEPEAAEEEDDEAVGGVGIEGSATVVEDDAGARGTQESENGRTPAEERLILIVMDIAKGDGRGKLASDAERALAASALDAAKRLDTLVADPKFSAAQARSILLRALDANLVERLAEDPQPAAGAPATAGGNLFGEQ